MRVTVHMSPRHAHHREYGDLFIAGLAVHGIKAKVQMGFVPTECDLAVIWGFHTRAYDVIDYQEQRERGFVVMERGYFGDRMHEYTSVGLNGQNGRADFCNANSPGDRWEQFNDLLKPWKPGKEYVLVIGQVPNDNTVNSMDIRAWVYDQIRAIKEADHKVVYWPHPLDKGLQRVPAKVKVDRGDLAKALKKAKCVVTFNSTSGVDAVMAGIPTIAMDEGSMAWPVVGHDLDFLGGLKDLAEPDREQWAHDLAYCQWSREELANGKAWAHLMGLQQEAAAGNEALRTGSLK